MVGGKRRWCPGLALACALFATTIGADAAKPIRECLMQHEDAQVARREGRFVEALEQLRACTDNACPADVREDCARWAGEVAAALPSMLVVVETAATQAVSDLELRIDGKLQASGVDGRARPIDPGEHDVEVRAPDGRSAAIKVVIRESEKSQRVMLALPSLDAEVPTSSGAIHPAAFVLGGVGLAGLGGFAALGLVGLGQETDLEETCAPNCTAEQIDDIEGLYLGADILLGVGAACVGAGVVVAIVSATAEEDVPADDAEATPQASLEMRLQFGGVSLGGTFF